MRTHSAPFPSHLRTGVIVSRWTLRRIGGLQPPADDEDGPRRAAAQRPPLPDALPSPPPPQQRHAGGEGGVALDRSTSAASALVSPGLDAPEAADPGAGAGSMYGLSALLPAPVVRLAHVRADDALPGGAAYTGVFDDRLRNALENGPGDPQEEHSPVLDVQWSSTGECAFAATDNDGRLSFFGVGDAAALRLGSAPYSQYLSYDYAQVSVCAAVAA